MDQILDQLLSLILEEEKAEGLPQIVNYEILAKLGEGGMGTVYLARKKGINRDVALKVTREDRMTADTAARFQVEFQVMAQMKHPNTARLLDAGDHEGRCFFTMDFYPGSPIDHYVKNHQPGFDTLIRLLIEAAEGLQHAHGHGVIHRDLKPSNILVYKRDGQPTPVIIDFGIARILGGPILNPQDNDQGLLIGTPAYMSPERLNGTDPANIQSDIYALGCVMKTLTTLSSPNGPPLTAAMLTQPGDTPLAAWVADLSHDRRLDWLAVVNKALAPRPESRYPTVHALIEDYRRLADDQPVSVRRTGPTDRLLRLKRKRPRTAMATLLAVLICTTALGLARQRALAESAARAQADQLSREVSATRRLVIDTLESTNPYVTAAKGGDHQPLDSLTTAVESRLAAYPELQLAARGELAHTRAALGDYREALTLYDAARQQAARVFGPLDERTLSFEHAFALMLVKLDRLDEAEQAYAQLIDITQTALGPNAPVLNNIIAGYAQVLITRGQTAQAEALLVDRVNPVPPLDTLHQQFLYREWGNLLLAQSKATQALTVFREVWVAQVRILGKEHLETTATLQNIALAEYRSGLHERALVDFESAYRNLERRLGSHHPRTAEAGAQWGYALFQAGQANAAIEKLQTAFQTQKNTLGERHLSTLLTAIKLASLKKHLGSFDESEQLLQQILWTSERRFGTADMQTCMARNNLADNYLRQGRCDKAYPLLEENLTLIQETFGKDHLLWLGTTCTLAETLMDLGQLHEAGLVLDNLIATSRGFLPADHAYHGVFAALKGVNLAMLSQDEEAEPQLHTAQTLLHGREPLYGELVTFWLKEIALKP